MQITKTGIFFFRILVVSAALAVGWGLLEPLSTLSQSVDAGLNALEAEAAELKLQLPPAARGVLTAAAVLHSVGALLALALILALTFLAAHRADARNLAWFLLLWFANVEFIDKLGLPPAGPEVSYLLVALAAAALLRFTALFPRALTREDLVFSHGLKAAGRLSALWTGLSGSISRLLLRPAAPWLVASAVGAALLMASKWEFRGFGLAVHWVFLIGAGLQSLAFLRTGYAHSDPAGRRRILWLFQGLHVVVWGVIFLVFLGLPIYIAGAALWDLMLGIYLFPLVELMNACVTVFVALAVFRDGGLDPALVIRRTAAYGALTVLLVFLAGAVQSIVVNIVVSGLHLSHSSGAWLAGGSVAIAFFPARAWCKSQVDRFLEDRLPATALVESPSVEATVVFTDLVGYTRLSAEDEPTALTLLSVFHKAVRRTANRHRGRVVKTLGDGALLTFTEARRALEFALNLKSSLEGAAQILGLPVPFLRTGLHAGSVAVARDRDVFGAAVNLAARLQGSAAPGEIIISREVAEANEIRDRFHVTPLGSSELKNVPEPVERFLISGPRDSARPS